jgi:hypothetical protein
MQQILSKVTLGLALTAMAALAQTKPAFEVATIKPSPPMDVAKIAAALQAGGRCQSEQMSSSSAPNTGTWI